MELRYIAWSEESIRLTSRYVALVWANEEVSATGMRIQRCVGHWLQGRIRWVGGEEVGAAQAPLRKTVALCFLYWKCMLILDSPILIDGYRITPFLLPPSSLKSLDPPMD